MELSAEAGKRIELYVKVLEILEKVRSSSGNKTTLDIKILAMEEKLVARISEDLNLK